MARRRHVRLVLALLALTAPVALVTGTATPSYADPASLYCQIPPPVGQADCVAPEARIYSAKSDSGFHDLTADPTTTSRDATFYASTKVADPDRYKVTYRCRLERDGAVVAGQDWQDCTIPPDPRCTDPNPPDTCAYSRAKAEYTSLVPGDYRVSVKAKDAATTPLGGDGANEQADPGTQFSWTVVVPVADTTPPDTRLTRAPKRWHLSQFGDWGYAGNEELEGARCTLQGRVLSRSCDSASAFATLTAGDWTFTVAGIDFAGNRDPSPAVNRFTVPVPSAKLNASSGWTRGTEIGYFFSGYATTRKKGATLSAARAGTRAVALVATKCPGCGSVKVTYAGKVLKRVSLVASSTRRRQLIPIVSWSAAHGGKVSVTSLSGKQVTIEGLGFSRRR